MRWAVFSALLPFLCASPRCKAQAAVPPAPIVTADQGLSEDEAVARALFENPELRAFRKQRAIAEGQIVSATALQNPLLQLQIVHFQDAASTGWTANLKWTPPQPVEFLARRSQARAHLDEVRYQIAEQEWALAAAVRATHMMLLELAEQKRIVESALLLRQRMGALLRARVERGGATRLELNLAQLAIAYTQRELDDVALRRTTVQSQLQGLLGVISQAPIAVRGDVQEDLAGVAPDPAVLAEQALANRPLLKAVHARITQSQQALRAEKARRWPWFELNGKYGQTGSTKYPQDWQAGIELPLPILNLNSGPIQAAAATLEQAQALEQAQIQALKQSVYAACAELAQRQTILLRYRREVQPVLLEHERLMELAARGGQIDLVALLSSEESVLRGRREYSEARLAYRRALLSLSSTVGTSLKEIAR